jgi:lipopolysaccharide/colanic/teichoic acid biosynthesis glycosyltransferase
LTPGLTGWAQVNGRDDLPIPIKVEFDEYYLKHRKRLINPTLTEFHIVDEVLIDMLR